jgi:bacterioferritin
MAITKEKLISLLNKDLELEYSAAIQYIQHSAVMTGAKYGDIIKELKIHANEEIAHALILADQIAFLGGVPSVDVEKIYVDANNETMLEQDLEGEYTAIKRYKERVGQAEELQEYALSQQLRSILADEQEHAMDIESALGK